MIAQKFIGWIWLLYTQKYVAVEDRENLFVDIIESENDVKNETYERKGYTNNEDVKNFGKVEEFISVDLSEGYCEVEVIIDEGNIYLGNKVEVKISGED